METNRVPRQPSPSFWVGLLVLSLVLGFFAVSEVATEIASERWPTSEGGVIWIASTKIGPSIRYEYEVGGKKFAGRDYGTGLSMASQCTVYYDPANPVHSRLSPGLRLRTLLLSSIPLLLLSFAVVRLVEAGSRSKMA